MAKPWRVKTYSSSLYSLPILTRYDEVNDVHVSFLYNKITHKFRPLLESEKDGILLIALNEENYCLTDAQKAALYKLAPNWKKISEKEYPAKNNAIRNLVLLKEDLKIEGIIF